MRKLIFVLAAVGLGISSTASAQTTYNITGGNFDSYASWNNNATGEANTLTFDNGEAAPAAVIGGSPGIVDWQPSNPGTQTGVYSGSITVDGSNNVTGGTLTVTGLIGYETRINNNSWWYNEHGDLVIDFGAGTATSTYSCYETAAAPASCAGGASTPASGIFAPAAGNEGTAGAARPAATFDGTTLEIFHEEYAGAGGTDYLTVWTLTTGPAGPELGADVSEAGSVGGVGHYAVTNGSVTSGVGVDIVNGATGAVLNTIEYFPTATNAWDMLAIATVSDGNSDGTADDPAIAVLAEDTVTGRIVVQTRLASDGSPVNGGWLQFFNSTNWAAEDVAVVNDINGDGTTGDTGIAVIAQNTSDNRYVVQMKLLSNGNQAFREIVMAPDWIDARVESFVPAGGGDSTIAVMGTRPDGFTQIQNRRVSDGASLAGIAVWGGSIETFDFAFIADGNADGTADDPAVVAYGKRLPAGNLITRKRDAATGAHLGTNFMISAGSDGDGLAVIDDVNGNNRSEIVAVGINGSISTRSRDSETNWIVADHAL